MRRLGSGPRKPGKPRRGAKTSRRREPRRFSRRALALGIAMLLATTALAAGAWLWRTGWVGRQVAALVAESYGLTARAGLAVQDVQVAGRLRTGREQILATLGVDRGSPILAFDPTAARDRLEALPWVREAVVRRYLPEVIFVRLVEREPLALWQLHGTLSVIDDSGEMIPGAAAKDFANLPLVVGEDAPRHAADLLAMLASEPELEQLVTAAVRVGGRRWNVQLTGGVDVHLPESEAREAWSQLARLQRQHGVLERDVVIIDLRLPDRLVIRTSPDGARARPDGDKGENT